MPRCSGPWARGLAARSFCPAWLRLAPENAFAGDGAGKPARLYRMADVELAGRRFPADKVGEAYADLLAPPWRAALGRRW